MSKEGATQGDPLAVAIYSISTTPLLNILINLFDRKHTLTVAFADDITSGGKIKELRSWWETLTKYGPLFGYFPQRHKSWIVVKKHHKSTAEREFHDVKINITTEGKRHLRAVIGNEKYRQQYC